MRYQLYVSPSLDGVLSSDSLAYDGVRRPAELLRALDGPDARAPEDRKPYDGKLLEQYFSDLYGVFMRMLTRFATEDGIPDAQAVKLQALLQEMIKVKRLIAASRY